MEIFKFFSYFGGKKINVCRQLLSPDVSVPGEPSKH